MDIPAPRDLKIGKIIDKTLGVIERNAAPSLIYVVALTAVSVPITWFAVGSMDPMQLLGGELLKAALGIACAFFLLVAALRRTGLSSRAGGDAFFPYIGLSVLYTLGFLLGVIAFILPGLFVMARWSVAQPMVVARGGGVMASLGESWERTKGNEFQIIIAAIALFLVPIAVLIAAGSFFEEGDPVGLTISQLASSAISVISLSMGVALYGMIVGGEQEARAFE
jgi:hypothetical protein